MSARDKTPLVAIILGILLVTVNKIILIKDYAPQTELMLGYSYVVIGIFMGLLHVIVGAYTTSKLSSFSAGEAKKAEPSCCFELSDSANSNLHKKIFAYLCAKGAESKYADEDQQRLTKYLSSGKLLISGNQFVLNHVLKGGQIYNKPALLKHTPPLNISKVDHIFILLIGLKFIIMYGLCFDRKIFKIFKRCKKVSDLAFDLIKFLLLRIPILIFYANIYIFKRSSQFTSETLVS